MVALKSCRMAANALVLMPCASLQTLLVARHQSQELPRQDSGLITRFSSSQQTLTLAMLGGLICTNLASNAAALMVVARLRSQPCLQLRSQHCRRESVKEMTVVVQVQHLGRPAIRHQMHANGQVVVVAQLARAKTGMVGCANRLRQRVHVMPIQIANGSQIDSEKSARTHITSKQDASKAHHAGCINHEHQSGEHGSRAST